MGRLRGMVIEADDAGYLPGAVFLVLPEGDEPGFSDVAGVAGVVEAVDADLYGSVIGNGIDLEGSGDEFPGDLAADVVLDSVDKHLTADGQAGFVVVELEILGDQRTQRSQVAVIVGIEELRIERLNGFEELIGCGRGLCASSG